MVSIGITLNNRYRLDKEIGEGGFAQVFLATDLELDRQVAVKVLLQNWAKDKELLARFRNEARAVAALDHPNILLIYDFGVFKGIPYLVMPYIKGGTFSARMRQSPLTLDEIGFYLDQVGSALDYAHQHRIIHRDLKPNNLLIRSDGQLVLMDFGLAKILQNTSLEAPTAVVGTAAYMAPEQFQGLVSAATDIYMLGILLYQMVARKLPYEGDTMQIAARMMLGSGYLPPTPLMDQPSMRSLSPIVVQALDHVIKKVLAKLPADRYPTCNALCYAYYEAIATDPERTPRSYSRNKKLTSPNFYPDATIIEPNIPSIPPRPAAAPLDATIIEPNIPSIPPRPAAAYPDATISEPNIPSIPPRPAAAYPDATISEPLNIPSTPLRPAASYPDATIIEPSLPQPPKKLLKPPCLVVTTEPDNGFRATFELTSETLTMGRSKDNDLYIPLPIISRHHAVFNRLNNSSQEPMYKIVQRQTINPLCFHGKRISEKVLENGDTIEIGERGYAEYVVKLTYQAPGGP